MKNCLALGGANCVFDDVKAALNLGEFHGVVTCNDVTASWKGQIDAAVSLHAEKWQIWMTRRRREGLVEPKRIYAHATFMKSTLASSALITHVAEHMWPGQKDSGSSGLFAVKVALDELGFDRVVCCGIPMTCEARHFFDLRPWGGAPNQRRGWNQAKQYLVERVRSMSGWTAELLGKPTTAWLEEEMDDAEADV